MKLFACQRCGQTLYFENTRCERCGSSLGYLPLEETLSALEPSEDGLWRPDAQNGQAYRFCANAARAACNWLIPAGEPKTLCLACELNRTIPNLDDARELEHWRRLEQVKHRLVYSVLRLGLPLRSKHADPEHGLAFDFLSSKGQPMGESVTTGHAQGVITIDTAEADPAEREQRRASLAEPYRTLAGHLRHEIGHYYWNMFRNDAWLEEFRRRFGDERADYRQALDRYYSSGPAPHWQGVFVSAYASAHPWEDWAETWAHYMHIVDTMETAFAFGIAPRNPGRRQGAAAELEADPYHEESFDALIEAWLPLTYAVNSLNRSMGQPDLYPFVLPPAAVDKLRFVHDSIRGYER